jgi:hypothetical protein
VESGADGIFHIDPIALADAKNDAGELREMIERVLNEGEVVVLQIGLFAGDR